MSLKKRLIDQAFVLKEVPSAGKIRDLLMKEYDVQSADEDVGDRTKENFLWRAAYKVLPMPAIRALQAAEEVENSTRITVFHVLTAHDFLDDCCRDYNDWNDSSTFLREPNEFEFIELHAQRRLKLRDDDSLEDNPQPIALLREIVYWEIRNAGEALYETGWDLKLPMSQSRPRDISVMSECSLCWKTGFKTRRGSHLCFDHHADVAARQEARQLKYWRDVDQSPKNHSSFQYLMHGQIKAMMPVEKLSPSSILPYSLLISGKIDLSQMKARQVDFQCVLPFLPLVRGMIRSHYGHAVDQTDEPRDILDALDPIWPEHGAMHRAMHDVLLHDQVRLVEMMEVAESWLICKLMMAINLGGQRTKGEAQTRMDYYVVSM